MPRDARAYLADVIEASDAITVAVHGLDLAGHQSNRLVRSSVEREFIIGEAVAALARIAPEAFDAITRARRIVDFRNRLTHEYPPWTTLSCGRSWSTMCRCFAASAPRSFIASSPRRRRAKRKRYQAIAQKLETLGIPRDHVKVLLREIPRENWGLAGGQAGCDIELGFKIEV